MDALDERWTRVSLRVMSEELTCVDISRALDLAPTKCSEKGTLASPRNPNSYRREAAVWYVESGLDSREDAEAHFDALLDAMEGREAALDLLAGSCTIEFYVGYSSDDGQGGFTLPSALCARIGRLPIDLSLDLYPPEGRARPTDQQP